MSSAAGLRELRAAAAVAAAFVLIHLLLLAFSFDAIDLEELEYGNLGVALLDAIGQPWQSFQTYPREGSRVLLTPLITPLFAIFGSSLWTLKLAGILGAALWAATWFLVARRTLPHGGLWAAGLLFALPMPLIQRAAISASSILAHLGASAWHGLALLLLLPHAAGEGAATATSRLRLVLSGLAAGLGVFCGFALAPLLPGVAWLVWRRGGISGLLIWGAATLPGMGWAFVARNATRLGSQTDLVVGLTGLESGGAFRGEGVGQALENIWITLVYGAGFGRVDEATLDLNYLPIGALWTLALIGLSFAAWRARRTATPPLPRADGDVSRSLLVSAAVYVGVLLFTGFKVETHYFDGPRYLLPLAPIALLALLGTLAALQSRPRQVMTAVVVASHVLGFALLCRPSVFPAPWDSVKGYEPWVRRQFLEVELQPDRIAPHRLSRWAVWAGLSEAWTLEGEGGWEQWRGLDAKHGLGEDGEAHDEFWRGFGVGILLAREQSILPALEQKETPRLVAPNTPEAIAARIWEGLAMGYNNVGCQGRFMEALLAFAPATRHSGLWYGFGRADIQCHLKESPAENYTAIFERGQQEGWRLDYWSGEGESRVDGAFLDRLYIY